MLFLRMVGAEQAAQKLRELAVDDAGDMLFAAAKHEQIAALLAPVFESADYQVHRGSRTRSADEGRGTSPHQARGSGRQDCRAG
jgi:hypothetical protein